MLRKLANSAKPTLTFTTTGGKKWSVKTETPIKTEEDIFNLDEEFDKGLNHDFGLNKKKILFPTFNRLWNKNKIL